MSRAGPPRGGFTVIEMAVALTLTALLLAVLLGSLLSLGSAVRRSTALAETMDAARIARTLGDRIATGGVVLGPGERADEVRVHLPIGWAEACDSAFVWRGIRAPDPERDSAVVVDSLSRIHRVGVEATALHPCAGLPSPPANSTMRSIDLLPDVPGARLVRVYESGVIRIDDAVRYARLGTPRQPLTAAGLDASLSGASAAEGRLRMVVSDSVRRWEGVWTAR